MDTATGAIVQRARDGTVLVLSMCSPPVNALSAPLRSALFSALESAALDPSVGAVVLTSALVPFSAGADLAELDDAPVPPLLPDLCARIETMEKPVVAALRGPVLGGGLELALGCHARVATEDARLGLPEVALGLLPGAGGTQRLPRLIGAEQALRMMLTGASISAVEGLALGLLDAVSTGDPVIRAKELARDLAGQPLRRSRDRRDGFANVASNLSACAAARRTVQAGRLPAPARIVDCVEAALLLPFEQGMAYERAAFLDLSATDEAAGLRRAFVAERRAQRLPADWTHKGAAPDRLLVWGADATGAGKCAQIVRAALQAGLRVTLADPSREALVATLEKIAAEQDQQVRKGRLSPTARDADWARLAPMVAPDRLAGVDAVILTRPGAPPIAQGIPVLSLSPDAPAAALGLALAGGPAGIAEIAVPDGAAPDRIAAAFALAKRLRWRAVPTRAGGPVAARLATALADCVGLIEAQGSSRADIAAALSAHGIAGEGRIGKPDPRHVAIARRCMAAMANEGARLVTLGVARLPATIDAVAIGAGLVARFTGGPMYQADRRGLLVLRRDLERWSADAPALFSPAPLIGDCLSRGKGLCDLDRA